jgi:hypothetical protein
MDQAGVPAGPQAAVMHLLREAAARLVNDGAPKEVLDRDRRPVLRHRRAADRRRSALIAEFRQTRLR